MADESQRPIIVKRIKKGGHGHHGGAWKIAYADFVTAMMAFFLLMWLLGSVSQGTLSGIAQYFRTPLKVALSGGDGAGDATSVIKGGGTDLTRQAGQVNRSSAEDEIMRKAREKVSLSQLKEKIQKAIENNSTLKAHQDQIHLEMTPQGLKIQIVDAKNRPTFNSGSAQMQPYMRELLQNIAVELNQIENKISIAGHTDARPYSSGLEKYSNWELSADRANAARRELVMAGLQDNKVLRIEGLASADPLNKSNLFSPENRRISILVLNKETADAIMNGSLGVGAEQQITN